MSEREAIGEQDFALVNSDISFVWTCTECAAVNYMSWSHFDFYGSTCECARCEKVHTVRLPWEKILTTPTIERRG